MSLLPIFVEWRDENKQLHQVPIVTFSVDLDTVVIIHKKEFLKVKLDEVRFARWDI